MSHTECNLARIWIIKSFDQTNYRALATTARTNLNKEIALEISRRFKFESQILSISNYSN
jgi:hypothetical protein